LENVELDVQAYQLRVPTESQCPQQNQNVGEQEKNEIDGPQARIIPLPSKEFDGIWESYG
jgi:pachytene checkpoint protein 2